MLHTSLSVQPFKMMLGALCLCLFLAQSNALFFGDSKKWDNLKAGFGVNPFSSNTFYSLPKTESEAVDAGWVKDTSAGGCGISGTKFNGNRYRKDNDQSSMLLFDTNGYIAGIQAGIPKTLSTYPAPQNRKYNVFLEEKDMWVVTAYFTDPSRICSGGRSKTAYDHDGIGDILAIQVGPSASDLLSIPKDEKDVTSKTKFVKGKCFYTMGQHYWYDISKDMSCDDTFPVFLLYNNGELNGFGWAFNPNYSNSGKWEHPGQSQFGWFMEEPPTCLGKDGPVTTLHVYMSDSPRLNLC